MEWLFDKFKKNSKIRAKKNDPVTSKRWAYEYSDSIRLTKDMIFALKTINEYPGNSARMLEEIKKLPQNGMGGKIWKVISKLEKMGLIYRINDGGRALKLFITDEHKTRLHAIFEKGHNP